MGLTALSIRTTELQLVLEQERSIDGGIHATRDHTNMIGVL
jgi:hypothetical protein